MAKPRADWMLPPGVTRGTWDYAHSEALAQEYEAGLVGSSLFAADIEFVLRHAGESGWLVDLGCGTGRLFPPMLAKGWRCVGVDLSPTMLRVAQKRTPEVGLIQADLVRLEGLADGAFDLACCLFSTLGMIAGADNRRTVVRQAARLLKPGGRFLLHVHNYWWNLWEPAGRYWLWSDLWGGSGDRPMPAHKGTVGLALHHFTAREVLELLRTEGLVVREMTALGLDGELPAAWCLGRLRAYGYLIAAERP